MTLLLLFRLAAIATAIGIAMGGALAWRLAAAGFSATALGELRAPLLTALALGGGVVLVLSITLGPLTRRLGERPGTAVASLLALVPVAIWAAIACNRRWAIQPQELFSAFSLRRNGPLLAALLVSVLLLSLLIVRTRSAAARRLARGGGNGGKGGWILWGVLVAAVLGVPALWTRAGRPPARPPVIVLLVDALRADGLGAYGNPRPTSPALDAFARDAVVFEQAISQSTFTRTSVASLFTGNFPLRHGVYWGGSPGADGAPRFHELGEEHETLAERFRDSGYLTRAWVQNSQILGRAGFGQGFLEYRDQQGSLARIHRALLPWLAGPAGREPFFAYVHYIDLHDPYNPGKPYDRMFGSTERAYAGLDRSDWGKTLEAVRKGEVRLSSEQLAELRRLYDGEIRSIDDGLGRLFDRLRESDLYDRSVIAVIADHGDGFGEHGFISHSTAPYDELLRVPLILKLPHGRAAGTRVAQQVRLIDLYPTLLELAGIAKPSQGEAGEIDGCSLVPLLRGEPRRSDACALSVSEIDEESERPTLALRTAEWKFIDGTRGPELYDLRVDPGERDNLAPSRPEEARRFASLAAEFAARRGQARATSSTDEALLRELRALGYLKQ